MKKATKQKQSAKESSKSKNSKKAGADEKGVRARSQVQGPARTMLHNVDCVVDGMGMAQLVATIKVVRIPAETIQEVIVLVDGASSSGSPQERFTSPVLQSDGTYLHTYDWQSHAFCGDSYDIQAIAKVTLEIHAASSIVTEQCPACP